MKATPLKLQRILQRLFAQQAREVASKLNLDQGTLPDMTHWTDIVAEAVKPLLLSMWQQGMVKAGANITRDESKGLISKRRSRMVLFIKAKKKTKPDIVVDFNLFDPKVLDAVDAAAYAFCRDTMATATGDMRTALDRLRELMRTGLARGDAVQLLAREVRNIFADPARAFRIATTECLTGDCVIKGANIKGVHRRHYSGTLVEAVVEGGQKISGSRNHPVLTQRGWVALGRLVQGDYLVCDTPNVDRSNRSIANEHNEHPPAALNDIFESLSTSAVVERVPMTPYDFHGDGSNGYVNVLTPARLLRHGFVPSRSDLRPGVQFRRLVDLRIVENWHGYVFNLDTIDGYYNANGIITQNSSRAMHAGSRMAGVESGVVSSWSWLCSSDACEEICQPLDGKTVKQGEPYAILSGKPPYNVIWHPPAHPHCFCTETENVD